MTITWPEVAQIDLPTIIVMVILWLIGFLKNRKPESPEVRSGPPRQ